MHLGCCIRRNYPGAVAGKQWLPRSFNEHAHNFWWSWWTLAKKTMQARLARAAGVKRRWTVECSLQLRTKQQRFFFWGGLLGMWAFRLLALSLNIFFFFTTVHSGGTRGLAKEAVHYRHCHCLWSGYRVSHLVCIHLFRNYAAMRLPSVQFSSEYELLYESIQRSWKRAWSSIAKLSWNWSALSVWLVFAGCIKAVRVARPTQGVGPLWNWWNYGYWVKHRLNATLDDEATHFFFGRVQAVFFLQKWVGADTLW